MERDHYFKVKAAYSWQAEKSRKALIWEVMVIYGRNKESEREELWKEIMGIKDAIGDLPWIIMGDYNEIWVPMDREGQ